MNINWEEKAWLEYLYWQTNDKKILGIEPDTVRGTLRQARAKLKKLLEN